MKKLSYLFLGAASLILAGCANDDLMNPGSTPGEVATVSIDLSIPQLQTRATGYDYSDGHSANQLQYAVYLKNADNSYTYLAQNSKTEDINISKNITFNLVTGSTYRFIFWAAPDAGSPYSVDFTPTSGNPTMKVNYSGVVANNEKLDAFYTIIDDYYVNGDASETAYLRRPFAQINVGTDDYEAAEAAGYKPVKSHIKIKNVYSTLDLVNGKVSDETEYDFVYSEFDREETFPVKETKIVDGKEVPVYEYMVMTYALVDAEQAPVEVEFDVTDGTNVRGKHTIGSVPVQRNHRTNIFGSLLTSQFNVNVIIQPIYDNPDNNIYMVADGVEYDKIADSFTISTVKGLQWLANQVNNQGSTSEVKKASYTYGAANVAFKDQTVLLANDIDLKEINWTPIGYETKDNGASIYAFAGTFDGQGHTIKNLKVDATDNNNAGFFGATNRATIKNLTIEGVNIKSHYKTGVIVGDGFNARIEDCHVKGGVATNADNARGIVNVTPWEITPGVYDDANNVGGIVGYLNGQPEAAWVKNCTVDGLDITAFRKIGGIAGVITTADDANPHTSSVELSGNTVTNTTLTADMREIRYDGFEKREAETGKICGSKTTERTTEENNTAGDDVSVKVISAKVDADGAVDAMKAGGNIYLTEDVTVSEKIAMAKGANVDFGGKTITNTTAGIDVIQLGGGAFTFQNGKIDNTAGGGATAGIYANSSKGNNITIENMEITATYPIYLNNAVNPECVIKSGTFISPYDKGVAVYVEKGGHVIIEGGFFSTNGNESTFLLNLRDDLCPADGSVDPRKYIEVRGGTFVNFDPSNSNGEPVKPANFVADGYKVISEQKGSDIHYTVVKE